jgi:hypothetical protein
MPDVDGPDLVVAPKLTPRLGGRTAITKFPFNWIPGQIMSEPTYDECLLAAEKVLGALEQVGETACLVGGMAVRLNGKKGRRVKVS